MESVTAIEEEKTTVKTLAGIKIDGERLRQKERDRKKEKEGSSKKKKITDQDDLNDGEEDKKGGFLGFFKFKNKNVEVFHKVVRYYAYTIITLHACP